MVINTMINTIDGVGKLVEKVSDGNCTRFAVKFDKFPERLQTLKDKGGFQNGLVYYFANEVEKL